MARFVVIPVALLCCYNFLSSSALELPPDGFWFNCGLDFCEFPAEYCRVIKGQRPSCQACTQDECYSLDTPSQCYSQCKALENGGSDGIGANQAAKEGLLAVQEEEKDRLILSLEENKRQWTIIYILVSIMMAMLIFIIVLLIKIRRDNRKQSIKDRQGTMRQLKAGPQQMTRFDDEETDVSNGITVEPAGASVVQKTMGETHVVDNCLAEKVPLLPPRGNKQPALAEGEQCQPSERSGNTECQFSSKLMDDGSNGLGRHMEESTNWPSNQAVVPVISHPIDEHMSTNLADCTLLDKHNMKLILNANVPSSRRHSTNDEETMTKNVFEKEDQVSLPRDIETQVQHRPRSTTVLNNVTPTAPPAESSISLSSERSGTTSGISTPDSGHYGTGNSSPNGSVDLKNNIMQQPAVNRQQEVES
ncbi:uncharacterized protein LOC110463262 [Mizuhopecten yessoensis]|uniref:TNFR-Cys domain-containing protein n=1 Tax=Mizuhopecten yessoensis TaxID=6573 RepID=A0A210PWL0_MIZYE|nr:uncharacterized protein LOC110463262 [Mizuhopecten yessoensis]OWF40863.1 hypothetical protein KP79_PYT06137 [Mizuhopecten yessoensis]